MKVLRNVLGLSVAAFCLIAVQAQAQVGVLARRPTGPNSSTTNLNSRTPKKVAYQAGGGVIASCGTSGCLVTTPLVSPVNVVCPSSTLPSSCTYYIHVEGQTQVTNSDNGLYQFLIDGSPVSPGPVDVNGFYSFQFADPNSGVGDESHSYAAIARASNSFNNQAHTIAVNIGCQDQNNDGCFVFGGFTSVEIAVSKP